MNIYKVTKAGTKIGATLKTENTEEDREREADGFLTYMILIRIGAARS